MWYNFFYLKAKEVGRMIHGTKIKNNKPAKAQYLQNYMVWHVITYGVYVGTKKIQKKSQVKNVQSLWIMWIQIIIIMDHESRAAIIITILIINKNPDDSWSFVLAPLQLPAPAGRLPFMTPVLHHFQSWIRKKKKFL